VRIIAASLTATLGSAVLSLTGCAAGSPSQAYAPPGPSAVQAQSRPFADIARSGRALRFLTLARFRQPTPRDMKPTKDRRPKDLYVSDLGTAAVEVLENTTYKNVGTITKGLVSPDGDFVDAAGNLYVADYDGVYIQEYKPGAKSPSFTYKRGMIDPVDVSVDSHGNVYEADYDGWYVNEYAQKSNAVINSCSPGGGVEGVAVDASNDVFVAYNTTASGSGEIAEYKGGLAGCNEKVLNVTLHFAGGMVVDAEDNLIVVDQTAPAVDIIARPYYSSIAGTLGSGFYVAPFHVTLGKSNKLAFVSDYYDVFVVDYHHHRGSLVTTLGSAYGWTYPAGAADDPNAVY
jgi:hypothetical protein